MDQKYSRNCWITLLVLFASVSAMAAPLPAIDKILQESTRPNPLPAPPPAVVPEIKAPEQSKPAQRSGHDEVRINVTQFAFQGNESIATEILRAAVAESENKALNFGELTKVVEQVEALYKSRGFFLAQAYLPPQKIRDGVIEISISEGKLGQTRLEGESRIKPDIVYAHLDQLPRGRAVKLADIERQVLLINDLAGSSATLDMQAGETDGTTDAVIAQKIEPLLSGRVEINNHGMPATGQEHLGVFLNASSPLGLGDKFSGNLMETNSGDLASYGLNYDLPVGAKGWRVTAAASLSQYAIGAGSAAALNAAGEVNSYRAGLLYPFLRSRNANLNLKLETALNLMHSSNNVTGADQNISRVLIATISGDWLDEWIGGGSNRAELAVTGGKLKLGSTALASDVTNTEGGYGKALLTLSREQNIRPNLTLQLQLTHQIASKNLDGSEKFSVGGPGLMPGYASGEASGDDGTLLKLKLNWRVRPDTALGLFTDFGQVYAAHHPIGSSDCNPDLNISSNLCHFTDAGFSLDWQGPHGITAAFLMAWALGEAPNPADNDRPRFWANVGYNW